MHDGPPSTPLHSTVGDLMESVVRLSGIVPSLWPKEAAISKARDLSYVTSGVSGALEIKSAE